MSANKYRARRTVVNGITFDSIAESRRYSELLLMLAAGDILDLELQPSFDLVVNDRKVGVYRADFRYVRAVTGEIVVEDVKGVRTPVYRLKSKLVSALYGFDVSEVAA